MTQKGHLHPITQVNRLSLKYFKDLGFSIMEGNDIESEWYNFDALNISNDHAARDMHDTFWMENKSEVLRTHNTGSESRLIKSNKIKPPLKLVIPGRDYRNENTDKTHEHTFYQIDGIYVDKKVNMGNLISILDGWIKAVLGDKVQTRFRPSYFPFVEPGLEIDFKLPNEDWLELGGAGMGHPRVLKNMGIDPKRWQAAMWGPGIDRFAMKKYQIDDLRKFHSQDLRFLKQF